MTRATMQPMTAHTKDRILALGFFGVGLYVLLVGALKGFQISHGTRVPWWGVLLAGLGALGLSWRWWPKGKHGRI